ncbi:hypothetical protein [Salinispira pacifica]|uniref:Outer membrane protein beta-barrel domain-containing protein n=1 Tax=Salinispira pacifica TaxID=1307761 RepID=V5WLW9_9SPIO|nr:hypothetical protein [Salinispira pacifica]AHC16081.1 hypothetical protein L21SP2_2729 [Salinispira pacifica]
MNIRRIMLMILMFSIIPALALSAQSGEDSSDQDEEKQDVITLRNQAGIAVSAGSVLLSPDIAILYRPGFWGVGAGVKGYAGLALGDAYIVPYATTELGWFSADLGISLRVRESNINSVSYEGEDLPLYISAGLHPSFKLGPGKLMLGASFDLAMTDVPVVESEDALESFFATLIVAIFSIFKVEGDIGYRISF